MKARIIQGASFEIGEWAVIYACLSTQIEESELSLADPPFDNKREYLEMQETVKYMKSAREKVRQSLIMAGASPDSL